MVLLDSSVWIEIFRKESAIRLGDLADFDEVVTCLPVIQEILQGFRDQRAYLLARRSLFSLPIVESPLGAEVFEEAVELYRLARRAGVTVRSSIDCLIAACAIRHRLPVLHVDRDFDALCGVSHLEARRVMVS